jgi:SAM-dependent methyltransferase
MDMILCEAEKQLLLSMGYFKDEPPNKKALLEFGKRNIKMYLVPWDTAYDTLIKKGLLQKRGNSYTLTGKGEFHRKALEKESPLWLYEYNLYFTWIKTSDAHKLFCETVYGKNLCQHGIADMAQLTILCDVLQLCKDNTVLDLGCGNGFITEWLCNVSGASFTGIDRAQEGIKQAHNLTRKNLHFTVGNMNHLPFGENSFDTIISIDTLYFADTLEDVITQLLTIVKPHSQMGIFYTQWINDDAEKGMLTPETTELAAVLNRYNLEYKTIDFTKAEEVHWEKKVSVLQELKSVFEKEGNLDLYEYRYDEAVYYNGWDPEKRSRYLYHVRIE